MGEFGKAFSLGKPFSASVYDELIYTLHEERTASWSIDTINNYLSVAYLVVSDSLSKKGGLQRGDYLLFNTGLESNFEYLYCIAKSSNRTGKVDFCGFLTQKDIISNYQLTEDDFSDLKSPKECLATGLMDFSEVQIQWPEDNYCESELETRFCWILNNCVTLVEGKPIVEDYKGPLESFHDWMHIIIDNCDRLPMSLLKSIIYKGEFNRYNNKYQIQYDILCNCLYLKRNVYKYLKKILEKAGESSIQFSKVDSDMIAPYYYPEEGLINYAMPLYLGHDSKPDCAFVFDQKGKIHTLLTMEQLRLNVKVIAPTKQYKWLL